MSKQLKHETSKTGESLQSLDFLILYRTCMFYITPKQIYFKIDLGPYAPHRTFSLLGTMWLFLTGINEFSKSEILTLSELTLDLYRCV